MKKLFHNLFEVGITIKFIDGILEFIGGVLIIFVSPTRLNQFVSFLTTRELSFDHHDWFINHAVGFAQNFSTHDQWFGVFYLASHGIIKVFIVANLWRGRLWAYPLGLIFFSLFALYQTYQIILTHSLFMILLTILDVVVIILTWFEYQEVKRRILYPRKST